MINNDGYIRYNHVDKSLLGIIKTAWFKSKERLQRIELIITLKIDNIDITNKLRKTVFEDSFTAEFIKQLKIRLVKGFVIIKNLLTF